MNYLSAEKLMEQANWTISHYMNYAETELKIKDVALQIEFAKACSNDFHTAITNQKADRLLEALTGLPEQLNSILVDRDQE